MPAIKINDPKFPRSHKNEHVDKLADAIVATEGVTLSREEALEIARLTVTRTADLINRKGQIASERIHVLTTRLGGKVMLLEVDTLPVGPSPANPRIAPSMFGKSDVRPMTPAGASHVEFAYSTADEAAEHIRKSVEALLASATEARRGYDLRSDMERRGQRDAGISVLAYVNYTQDGNQFRQPRLMAITGNNRALTRLQILGFEADELVFLPADLRGWWEDFVKLVAEVEATGDPADEAWDGSGLTPEALKVALRFRESGIDPVIRNLRTSNLVVVGWDASQGDLMAQLDELNLDTHLHPPAQFDDNARGLALFATIVNTACRKGVIPQERAAALLGHGDLAAGGFTDKSSRRLEMIRLLFPKGNYLTPMRMILQEVLGEPVGTKTTNVHAKARCRILGAVWFDGQNNPRVADGLMNLEDSRYGANVAWDTTTELIAAAATDPTAAKFLTKLGPLLLAEVGAYEASRGSSDVRREPSNVVRALERDPVRALAVLTEVVTATVENRAPELTDVNGEKALPTPEWLIEVFPKTGSAFGAPGPVPVRPANPGMELLTLQTNAMNLVRSIGDASAAAAAAVKAVQAFAAKNHLSIAPEYGPGLDGELTTSIAKAMAVTGEITKMKVAAQTINPVPDDQNDDEFENDDDDGDGE